MPIVTLTENEKTRFHAVTEGDECSVDAVVDVYGSDSSDSREYAEHALRREYLKRLTEHAYDCAHLAHFVDNPPDAETLVGNLHVVSRLMAKVVEGAVWLRTYEPFTALTAEVVAKTDEDGNDTYGTALAIGGTRVSCLDDDSWDVTADALRVSDPRHRDNFARIEREKAERDAEHLKSFTPAERKRIASATKLLRGVTRSSKKRAEKAVANKTLRRSKRKAK